jgi:2,2-dialkylglycine decarboxylase (pyruvate)
MCATLGHNHPRVVEAIAEASKGALHLFSGMLSPPVVELSRRLAGILPSSLAKAMFLSTGGEANEAALKMAKLHTGKFEVVGFTGAWHGMTSGAQSVNYRAVGQLFCRAQGLWTDAAGRAGTAGAEYLSLPN